ncbi:uncharacterized protein B0H18DRAFT_989048 [Fomitopsis serialis]|uniref:uncharacterized protein n=1 Tax=Fomitopsis serialis TaxID=139415 RepID=UPI002007D136|nr:uncharacterized protein B0H18DRAFT_1047460 [Neoantrodia serialis]XP_047897037.1 uncharacterized protein B0H18DRAFT_989048 [Neoantrodia serialis]KAH9913875.1 hypothetical protein B0H18DRAFT_1047460 [Neoantrodia serialis]KAH9931984.1 hypothetical protein B0H18DRAFT_989048 [Neoantrodia serialis]
MDVRRVALFAGHRHADLVPPGRLNSPRTIRHVILLLARVERRGERDLAYAGNLAPRVLVRNACRLSLRIAINPECLRLQPLGARYVGETRRCVDVQVLSSALVVIVREPSRREMPAGVCLVGAAIQDVRLYPCPFRICSRSDIPLACGMDGDRFLALSRRCCKPPSVAFLRGTALRVKGEPTATRVDTRVATQACAGFGTVSGGCKRNGLRQEDSAKESEGSEESSSRTHGGCTVLVVTFVR